MYIYLNDGIFLGIIELYSVESFYSLISFSQQFWENGVKYTFPFSLPPQERVRTYMNRVKEIAEKKKASKLDKGAASRFVRNALWEPSPENEKKSKGPGKGKKRKMD